MLYTPVIRLMMKKKKMMIIKISKMEHKMTGMLNIINDSKVLLQYGTSGDYDDNSELIIIMLTMIPHIHDNEYILFQLAEPFPPQKSILATRPKL